MKKIFNIVPFLLTLILLMFFIKGAKDSDGFLKYQTDHSTVVGGPYELSNSTARYALTESIVKDKSLTLSESLAKFSSPDVVDYRGKFISIFTPGVSFVALPFYLLGVKYNIVQIGTYLATIIVASLNAFLIFRLSQDLGAGKISSLIGALVFVFATNGLAYSLTLTQHHYSVLLLLLGLLLVKSNRFMAPFLLGITAGLSVLVDIPNLILFTPIIVAMIFKNISYEKSEVFTSININFIKLVSFGIGLVMSLSILVWYNLQTTGSYTKLAQNIGRSKVFSEQSENQNPQSGADSGDIVEQKDEKSKVSLPFKTRHQLNGLYTLMLSNERSWIFYSPVLFFGTIGIYFMLLNKKTRLFGQIISGVILLNIVMYSMFGDPWGGWGFGPRYLIPSAALMSVGISVWLSGRKNMALFIAFLILLVYSIFVNTLGSLTTAAIPPKIEAVNLPEFIPYTYQYNWNLLNSGSNSSLFYDIYAKGTMKPTDYFYGLFGVITFIFILLNTLYLRHEKNADKNSK
jgi:hypothetical protein